MGGEFYINRHNEHLIDRYITNSNKSIIIDYTKDSDTLLITFCGRGALTDGPETLPPFEFFRSTQSMGVNRMIIRDAKKAWYHKGLSNISDVENFDQVVTYLEDIIPVHRFKKILVMGLSMGGYAAILFGLLTRFNVTVHAFGPQTYIDIDKKEYPDELSWIIPILKEIPSEVPREYLDLRNIFLEKAKRLPHKNNEYHIYYGTPDRAYAERLSGFEKVHLHEYDINVHNITGYFRNRGELTDVLNQLLFTRREGHWNEPTAAKYDDPGPNE
ncbi:lysophospholipase [Paenibacillus soyae]|uniref:Lysophospholipase n=1 Tax=Paenibacillus soyae TaxID=2969249 RepID=A0A9X2MNW9_9BACL|nr:lysophospholipase [Paenibacillus soyae]MCR2805453.1 lysophospholipase [Paenibacillus soyae]